MDSDEDQQVLIEDTPTQEKQQDRDSDQDEPLEEQVVEQPDEQEQEEQEEEQVEVVAQENKREAQEDQEFVEENLGESQERVAESQPETLGGSQERETLGDFGADNEDNNQIEVDECIMTGASSMSRENSLFDSNMPDSNEGEGQGTIVSELEQRESSLFDQQEQTITSRNAFVQGNEAEEIETFGMTDGLGYDEDDAPSNDLTPAPVAPVAQSQQDNQLARDLIYLRKMFNNADYQRAIVFLEDRLLSDNQGGIEGGSHELSHDELTLFNSCLIISMFKLADFASAKTQCLQLLKDIEKHSSLSLDADERAFPVKYMLSAVGYEEKSVFGYDGLSAPNAYGGLQGFYCLLRETEAALKKNKDQVKSGNLFDTETKITTSADILNKELHEVFGMFPAKTDYAGKYIMLAHEVCRVHTRLGDYRNAFKIMKKCKTMFPSNPYVLSKMGRLCLEVGKKKEALVNFQRVSLMLGDFQATKKQKTPKEGNLKINLEAILGDQPVDTEIEKQLSMLVNMNDGFTYVFDAQYDAAISSFRKVQTFRPANLIATNNIATCQIFCNQAGKAIDLLLEQIKLDPRSNINEQVIQNMNSFYEVHYPAIVKERKEALIEICSKNSKDAVTAYIVRQRSGKA